jgi:protein-tyrosine-phosphatase/predicted ATP-grasp superfamily ATP-dependent carboligase
VTAGKVLVLGDDTRSFLAIVRSLGRRGISVHAAPANFRSPALRSRYIAAIHYLPPWMGDGAEWLSATAELLRAERYDLIIPCNETTLLPLQRHRATLSRFARLAIPDDRAIVVLFDKHETRELARRVGVRVAAGRLLRADDTAEGVLTEFGAPVVVKPRHSYSLERLAARGKVEVVAQPARLEQLLGGSDPDETVLEQYFAGQGVGVSVLASRGRVLQAFEHHRVREVAGASFYRYSAPATPDLTGACEAIVADLDYTGLAMFEFKQNAGADWVLLEVNARPWGSMPLPVALGVDFPYRWYRLLTAGEETPAAPYRTGVYGRNLVPDLQMSLIEAEARQRGPAATAWFMLRCVAELPRFLTGREVHDVLVRDDPRPGLLELLEIIRAVRGRMENRLPGAAARRRRRARVQVRALRKATVNPRITFVCQGNICRSPFAEALLRARLRGGTIEIGSAGVMPQPGRPTPIFGIEAAAAHGIDLSAHRSAWLTSQLVDSASLLIAFDEITRCAVFYRYPNVKAPVMLLGDLAELGDLADPIDGGAAEFRRVYDQIAAAVAELAGLIRGAMPSSITASELCERDPSGGRRIAP